MPLLFCVSELGLQSLIFSGLPFCLLWGNNLVSLNIISPWSDYLLKIGELLLLLLLCILYFYYKSHQYEAMVQTQLPNFLPKQQLLQKVMKSPIICVGCLWYPDQTHFQDPHFWGHQTILVARSSSTSSLCLLSRSVDSIQAWTRNLPWETVSTTTTDSYTGTFCLANWMSPIVALRWVTFCMPTTPGVLMTIWQPLCM